MLLFHAIEYMLGDEKYVIYDDACYNHLSLSSNLYLSLVQSLSLSLEVDTRAQVPESLFIEIEIYDDSTGFKKRKRNF